MLLQVTLNSSKMLLQVTLNRNYSLAATENNQSPNPRHNRLETAAITLAADNLLQNF